jgi:hypothetical protein
LIKFDRQLVEGLDLFEFEPEANVNQDYKICGFECIKRGEIAIGMDTGVWSLAEKQ